VQLPLVWAPLAGQALCTPAKFPEHNEFPEHLDASPTGVTQDQVRRIGERHTAMREDHHALMTEFPAHRSVKRGAPPSPSRRPRPYSASEATTDSISNADFTRCSQPAEGEAVDHELALRKRLIYRSKQRGW
jgi:hypothetical protein